jgi:hypothetical protein
MKRIVVLAGVLAIAVAAPASAEPVGPDFAPGFGLTTAESTGTPALLATHNAVVATAEPRPSGVTPGRGMETALSAQTPGVTP